MNSIALLLTEKIIQKNIIKPEDKERLIRFRNNPSDESWIGGTE